ncbi:hypothetical protein [Streptomyces virginiae]
MKWLHEATATDAAHTYRLVAHLLADPATRDIGARLARAACHEWRAAPVELLPVLVRYCGPEPGPAMIAALTTASISDEAMRVHGAAAATAAFTPYPKPRDARRCHDVPAYDSVSAAAALAARPIGIGRFLHAPEVFGALLDAGPLTFRQAAQLYNLTFRWPNRMQAVSAPLWLRHAGPGALPRLLALMTPRLADHTVGEYYLEALARMGRAALPALPAVTAMIERRTRIPTNDSTRDGEMLLDECLLRAAVAARGAILADVASAADTADAGDMSDAADTADMPSAPGSASCSDQDGGAGGLASSTGRSSPWVVESVRPCGAAR